MWPFLWTGGPGQCSYSPRDPDPGSTSLRSRGDPVPPRAARSPAWLRDSSRSSIRSAKALCGRRLEDARDVLGQIRGRQPDGLNRVWRVRADLTRRIRAWCHSPCNAAHLRMAAMYRCPIRATSAHAPPFRSRATYKWGVESEAGASDHSGARRPLSKARPSRRHSSSGW